MLECNVPVYVQGLWGDAGRRLRLFEDLERFSGYKEVII